MRAVDKEKAAKAALGAAFGAWVDAHLHARAEGFMQEDWADTHGHTLPTGSLGKGYTFVASDGSLVERTPDQDTLLAAFVYIAAQHKVGTRAAVRRFFNAQPDPFNQHRTLRDWFAAYGAYTAQPKG